VSPDSQQFRAEVIRDVGAQTRVAYVRRLAGESGDAADREDAENAGGDEGDGRDGGEKSVRASADMASVLAAASPRERRRDAVCDGGSDEAEPPHSATLDGMLAAPWPRLLRPRPVGRPHQPEEWNESASVPRLVAALELECLPQRSGPEEVRIYLAGNAAWQAVICCQLLPPRSCASEGHLVLALEPERDDHESLEVIDG
jgi:hypothetical protein